MSSTGHKIPLNTNLYQSSLIRNPKQIQNSHYQDTKRLLALDGRFCFESRRRDWTFDIISDFEIRILVQGQDFSILYYAVVLGSGWRNDAVLNAWQSETNNLETTKELLKGEIVMQGKFMIMLFFPSLSATSQMYSAWQSMDL